jgi:hypothetical protein
MSVDSRKDESEKKEEESEGERDVYTCPDFSFILPHTYPHLSFGKAELNIFTPSSCTGSQQLRREGRSNVSCTTLTVEPIYVKDRHVTCEMSLPSDGAVE